MTREKRRDDTVGYLKTVIKIEWLPQAEGVVVDRDNGYLEKLNSSATSLKPANIADGSLDAPLQSLARLCDGRKQRSLAAETVVPAVGWIVTIVGGTLTSAFCSLLCVPSLAMHLAMSAVLAISGAPMLILMIALSNPFRGDFRVSTYRWIECWRKFRRRQRDPEWRLAPVRSLIRRRAPMEPRRAGFLYVVIGAFTREFA